MILIVRGEQEHRDTDLVKIAGAADALPLFASGIQGRQQHRGQNADHGDDRQEFDQCETGTDA